MQFNISSISNNFRVKQMSIIEVLAIRSNISVSSIDESIDLFNNILERIEVEVEGKWIPLKYPNSQNMSLKALNEDIHALREIIDVFISKYLKSVFTKSNESSN